MTGFEVQCDGLVGPTHNYAGLSHGNVASAASAQSVSNPRKAALQGIEKMRRVHALGLRQLVIPPPPRPNFRLLHHLGFRGSPAEILASAWKASPAILYQAYSAASMWTANLATVTPSFDSGDQRLHLTPANLASTAHRAQESAFGTEALRTIFGGIAEIHEPLPANLAFTDEGAANHMRLCADHGEAGIEIFVYGRSYGEPAAPQPARYPARQTRQSVEALARLHQLPEARSVFVQQHPAAIDAGVFHNDVIAMSNGPLLIYHERAFLDEARFLHEVERKLAPTPLQAVRITESELPLAVAVESYFFNSQLLSLPDGRMIVLAPAECRDRPLAYAAMERLRTNAEIPIDAVEYLDLRESMRNGGGPACLRLRVPLDDAAWADVHPAFIFDPALETKLTAWIHAHYRDRLQAADLQDAGFAGEAIAAWEALGRILPLPAADVFS